MANKFLIDQCLSTSLVGIAKARGCHAAHVSHVGMSGWQDWNLVSYAFDNDLALVTNNRKDFLKEYAKLEVHNGLVIIIPSAARADQERMFALALDRAEQLNEDIVNKLIEVQKDGTVEIRDWTSTDHNPDHISRKR